MNTTVITPESLVGVWMVQSALFGVPSLSQLVFMQDGTYTHALTSPNVQRHWGRWTFGNNGVTQYVRFDLAGGEPQYYVGPLGSVPIHWPPFEVWMILSNNASQIQTNGGIWTRQQPTFASPPAMAAPSSPSQYASIPHQQSWVNPAHEQWMQAQKDWFEATQKANRERQQTFERSNQAFLEYLRS